MKRFISWAVLFIMLIMIGDAMGITQIQFTWNGAPATSFNLYIDDQIDPVLNIPGDVREWEGVLEVPEGLHNFYLTAVLSEPGVTPIQESPRSAPYEYYYIEQVPVIIRVQ